jgi:hypothetical protein
MTMSKSAIGRTDVSSEVWDLVRRYDLDRDQDGALEVGDDKAAAQLDTLVQSGKLSGADLAMALSLQKAFVEGTTVRGAAADLSLNSVLHSGSRLKAAAEVKTADIMQLPLDTLKSASPDERLLMLSAILDDFAVWNDKEEKVLDIMLRSTPESDRAALAERLRTTQFSKNRTYQDQIVSRLASMFGGDAGGQRLVAQSFFDPGAARRALDGVLHDAKGELRSPKDIRTGGVMALHPDIFQFATLDERCAMIQAIVDDFFVFNDKEDRVLELLSYGLSEQQQALLAKRLVESDFKAGVSYEEQITKRLGSGIFGDIGGQQAKVRAFFDKAYWNNTTSLDVDSRVGTIQKYLSKGSLTPKQQDYMARLLTEAPSEQRQALVEKLNSAGKLQTLLSRLSDGQKSAAFALIRAEVYKLSQPEAVASVLGMVGLEVQDDVGALADFFGKLAQAHAGDATFCNAVAERLRSAGFFAPWEAVVNWAPQDLDTLERFATDPTYRDSQWAQQAATFARFRNALPAGSVRLSYVAAYDAHHDAAALQATYNKKLQEYYASAHSQGQTLFNSLKAQGATVDETLRRQLRERTSGGQTLDAAAVDQLVAAASQNGWLEGEQMALLEAVLAGDGQLMFKNRAAFKRAFDVATQPAINDAMWHAIEGIAASGISAEEVEGLVEKFAWAPGRDGTLRGGEKKALEEALRRWSFNAEARDLATKLVGGTRPADLGLLNTNLPLGERLSVIDRYLADSSLTSSEQAHLCRLLRDTPQSDRAAVLQKLAAGSGIATAMAKLTDSKSAGIARDFFLDGLATLTDAAVVARGVAAVGPNAARFADFINDAVRASCGADPTANADFVRRVLERPELEPLRHGAMQFTYWQAPADLPALDRLANDPAFLNQAWDKDRRASEAFTNSIDNRGLRRYFTEAYDSAHSVKALQAAFQAGVAQFYAARLPLIQKWYDGFQTASVRPDAALFDQLAAAAMHGGMTQAELSRLISRAGGNGLSQTEKSAIAKAVMVAGPEKLFGTHWQALSDVLGLTPYGNAKVDGSGGLVVWKGESQVASHGAVSCVGLGDPVTCSADGLRTRGVQVSGKDVLSSAEGQAPFEGGGSTRVTRDAFDQVQALWAAHFAIEQVRDAGVDVDKLLSTTADGGVFMQNRGIVRIKVNGAHDSGAKYSPGDNEIVIGAGPNGTHLAADADVVTQQVGRLLATHAISSGSGETAAIREGFASAVAALVDNDPELTSTTAYGTATQTVDNHLTVGATAADAQARSQVYAGFVWAAKKQLAKLQVSDDEAARLLLGVLVNHASRYGAAHDVHSDEFVTNMLLTVRAQLVGKVDARAIGMLQEAMVADAKTRGLVPTTWVAPAVS